MASLLPMASSSFKSLKGCASGSASSTRLKTTNVHVGRDRGRSSIRWKGKSNNGPLGEVSCLASHSSHGSGASDSSSSGGTSSAGSHTTSRRTSSKTSSGSRSCSPGRSNAAAAKHTQSRLKVATQRASSYVATGDDAVQAWARGEESSAATPSAFLGSTTTAVSLSDLANEHDDTNTTDDDTYTYQSHLELVRAKLGQRKYKKMGYLVDDERPASAPAAATTRTSTKAKRTPADVDDQKEQQTKAKEEHNNNNNNAAAASAAASAAAAAAASTSTSEEQEQQQVATGSSSSSSSSSRSAATPSTSSSTHSQQPPPPPPPPPPITARKKRRMPITTKKETTTSSETTITAAAAAASALPKKKNSTSVEVPALLRRPSRSVALKRRSARRDRFLSTTNSSNDDPSSSSTSTSTSTSSPESSTSSSSRNKATPSDADQAEVAIAELRMSRDKQRNIDTKGKRRARRMNQLLAADDETVPEVMTACEVLTRRQEAMLLPAAKRYCRIEAYRTTELGIDGGIPSWPEVAARMQYRGATDAKRHYEVGRQALSLLVEHNLRLVVTVSRKYLASSVLTLPDLIVAGSAGITKAVEKFDTSKGYKFSTYATWWIRQNVSRCVTSEGRLVRFPVHVHDTLHRVKRAIKELEEERMRGLHHESNGTEAGNGRGGSGETSSAAASSSSERRDAPGVAGVAGAIGQRGALGSDEDVFLADGSLNPAAKYPSATMASRQSSGIVDSSAVAAITDDVDASGNKSNSASLTKSIGYSVTPRDIAKRTGLTEGKVVQVLKWNAPVTSVDAPLDTGGTVGFNLYADDHYSVIDSEHLMESSSDPHSDSAGAHVGGGIMNDLSSLWGLSAAQQATGDGDSGGSTLTGKDYDPLLQTEAALHREKLDAALRSLTVRERNVLRMRWGLVVKGGRGMSYVEISDIYGLTKERIRQIEEKALRKLRQPAALVALRGEFKSSGGEMR